nr:MAG TPA: hypothetical protein [Caudoviricetes sp.]
MSKSRHCLWIVALKNNLRGLCDLRAKTARIHKKTQTNEKNKMRYMPSI